MTGHRRYHQKGQLRRRPPRACFHLSRLAGIFWRDFVSETEEDQDLQRLARAFKGLMSKFVAERLATVSEEEDEAPQSLNRRKSGKSGRRKTKNVRSVMSLKAIFKD